MIGGILYQAFPMWLSVPLPWGGLRDGRRYRNLTLRSSHPVYPVPLADRATAVAV